MKHILTVALALCAAFAQAATYSGTLPVIHINTDGSAPITSKETYVSATYWLDPMGVGDFQAFGSEQEPLPLQIRGRGNYTWTGFDKKPYRLKLASKADLLGLGSSKHWALLAHADDSYGFLRNPMGFWLSSELGMPWTPGQQPVEVVLNGDYIGLYFLTETIRVDKNRVNIVEQPDLATDPEEITGGWLVELDNYPYDPHVTIREGDGTELWFTYKTPEVLSQQQETYLTDQMEAINDAVYSEDRDDCAWADMVDLETLAKFYIVQEVMDNYESFHGSCYLYRQQGQDQKWMFGPVWDFGSSFNEDKSRYIYSGRQWHNAWIGQMCQFSAFMDVVKALWANFYETKYDAMLDYAQSFADYIAAGARADAQRWPQYGNADEQERCQVVKDRLSKSCKWLAKQWGGHQQGLEPITVYYLQDEDNPWDEVYAYSWDQTTSGKWYNMYGDWPGAKMTPTAIGAQQAWTITVFPEYELSDHAGLIFDNGHAGKGNQTADLILYNNHVYRQDGSHEPLADALNAIATEPMSIRAISGGIEVVAASPLTLSVARPDGTVREYALPSGRSEITLSPGLYIAADKKLAVH